MLNVIMPCAIMPSVIMLSVIMPSVIMLSVIMLSVIMPSVIMLSILMLSVVMLRVVMLSVAAPLFDGEKRQFYFSSFEFQTPTRFCRFSSVFGTFLFREMAGLDDEPVLLAKLEQLLGGRDQVPIF
jgi:hypothetical protein